MRTLWVLSLLLCLPGCNWVNQIAGLSKDNDRATGAACRQTGRSLEECYRRNPEAEKSQIFAGWREMQEYMVKQALPTLPPPPEPLPESPAREHAPEKKDTESPQSSTTSDHAGEGSKVDPEVQAVLDTVNGQGHRDGVQPSNEQKQLRELLKQGAESPLPPKK